MILCYGPAPAHPASVLFHLIDRGLATTPTAKRPAKPPALSTVHRMLTNLYYKGQVSFRGASYDGLHEPLVTTEVWYRVQAVLGAHQVSGEKTQTHDHYLKGTVYCGKCGFRLILTNARSRQGTIIRTSSAPDATPNAPTAPGRPCSCPTWKPLSRTTTGTSRSPNTSSRLCAS
ncbi:recombinase family protein [uncultured Bifidobacterium sp.]|uniref:recombinase family protein n=1 Tax=uncultured Bifidobacterium sp. TaxID=165187 RepID=UPI00345A9EA9